MYLEFLRQAKLYITKTCVGLPCTQAAQLIRKTVFYTLSHMMTSTAPLSGCPEYQTMAASTEIAVKATVHYMSLQA